MPRTTVALSQFALTVNANNAIALDGSAQYGKILNSAILDALNGSDVTVEFWIYRNGNQPTTSTIPFEIGGASTNAFSIFTDSANYATLGGIVNYSGDDSYRYADTSLLPSVTWTHVAFVFNATAKTVSIYKNGASYGGSVASQPGSGTMQNPAGMDLYLGSNRSAGKLYKGSFACMRIWNVARTAAQIAANYLLYLDPARETGLVINCNIIEGSGTTVENTGTGNDLILTGSPSWTTGPTLNVKDYNSPRVTAGARTLAGTRIVNS